MIEVTSHPHGQVIVINPSIIAVVTRPDHGEFTEIVLTIQGGRDNGPMCYRAKELPEDIHNLIRLADKEASDRKARDLVEVLRWSQGR